MTLDPILYWKLRALSADVAHAQKTVLDVQQKCHAVLREAGLDTAVNYVLRDEDTSATPQPPDPSA